MFNIGMMELILVLLVAFVVVGPKDLPKVARWVARQVKSVRRIVREIKKETGWDEFAKEFRDTRDDLSQTMKDADVRADLDAAAQEVKKSVDSVRKDVESAGEELRSSITGNAQGGNEA